MISQGPDRRGESRLGRADDAGHQVSGSAGGNQHNSRAVESAIAFDFVMGLEGLTPFLNPGSVRPTIGHGHGQVHDVELPTSTFDDVLDAK